MQDSWIPVEKMGVGVCRCTKTGISVRVPLPSDCCDRESSQRRSEPWSDAFTKL